MFSEDIFITYVSGGEREAPSLGRQHVCEFFSETVDALHNGKRPHADLYEKYGPNKNTSGQDTENKTTEKVK